MAQIFHPSTNTIARLTVFGAAFVLGGVTWALGVVSRSSYTDRVGVAVEQPVPFSHKHHVGSIGLDCRYCHTAVERGPDAGIPPTATCMNCHTQIWSDSPMLEPVRESWRSGEPMSWVRVHDLPDFAYFDHSIHLSKGIGCSTCHGRVDQMPLMRRENTLFMEWCLDCHRHPEKYVRPVEEVFNMGWQPPSEQLELGRRLVQEYDIASLTTCNTCHR
ncbi:MAG: cytochrome c3 family protein [Acidobacteriota bacterium]|jgi:hypothetical protein